MTSGRAVALELMMRTWILIGALLFVAGCGAYSFPGSPSTSTSTGAVSGRVIAVPCAPVQPAPKSCAGRPVGGLQISFESGNLTESTATDSNGGYSIQLTPGTWKVRLATYMRLISGPTLVTLSADSNVVANYVLDSGIRVPVPQA